jgi:hypothetical protein
LKNNSMCWAQNLREGAGWRGSSQVAMLERDHVTLVTFYPIELRRIYASCPAPFVTPTIPARRKTQSLFGKFTKIHRISHTETHIPIYRYHHNTSRGRESALQAIFSLHIYCNFRIIELTSGYRLCIIRITLFLQGSTQS